MNIVINKPTNILITLTSFIFCTLGIVSFFDGFYSPTIYVFKYFFLIALIALILITSFDHKYSNPTRIVFLFLISFVSFINLFTINQENVLSPIVYIISTIFLAFIVLFVLPKIKEDQFNRILKVFLFTTTILVTLPSILNINNPELYYTVGDRYRFLGFFDNPNELARYSLLVIMLSLRVFNQYKNIIIKILLLSLIIASFYIISATDSRTNLYIGIILGVIYFIMIILKLLPSKLKVLFITLLSCTFLVSIYFILYQFNVSTLDLNQLTSDRFFLWSDLFNVPLFQQLFGQGQPEVRMAIANGYLEIFNTFGFIGLGLWIFLILTLLIKKLGQKRKTLSSVFSISIIISFLIFYLFEGGLVSFGNVVSFYFWMELSRK